MAGGTGELFWIGAAVVIGRGVGVAGFAINDVLGVPKRLAARIY